MVLRPVQFFNLPLQNFAREAGFWWLGRHLLFEVHDPVAFCWLVRCPWTHVAARSAIAVTQCAASPVLQDGEDVNG